MKSSEIAKYLDKILIRAMDGEVSKSLSELDDFLENRSKNSILPQHLGEIAARVEETRIDILLLPGAPKDELIKVIERMVKGVLTEEKRKIEVISYAIHGLRKFVEK